MLLLLTLLAPRLELVVNVGLVLLTRTARTLVHLGSDGVRDVRQLLLLLLEILGGGLGAVLLEPVGSLLDGLKDLVCSS